MIEFKKVGKIYPNGTEALKSVSATIEQGEFVAVIGLSGAGKSTLIKLVNKMHGITSGELVVNGISVDETLRGKKLRRFRRQIGMVFQSFNLIGRTTVIRNVLAARVADMGFFQSLFGIYSKKDKIIALEALDKVGILEKAYSRADQLSGGQQQRVALARTIAQNPSIILADEPVASLDPITANTVMKDFARVNRDLNITVVANMHHVDMALKYARRVIGIRDGNIIFDGPSSEVNENLLKEIYGRDITDEDIMFKAEDHESEL
ncbi:phosphonate ABC transporter ATP-binding protein [Liberiplasma polymorphum]|jgi:phosphonate transport system ATP-binding protein|uniref:phosphonate ABC transporter ATP-binding protein n=1 Tax=Liberiplasma polymorphum TaxID=3374570 RepID=UPI00377230DF